ncbi:hypothetical protein [Streptomyces sp. CAU 1734]|uniref:hypothetical protein n=1 Tax=Streptomyces sp. CAU 1734 TaxID=3140360 RepID=UPI00326132D4
MVCSVHVRSSFIPAPADQFTDHCTHLRKEAVSRHCIEVGSDLQPLKFPDITPAFDEPTEHGPWPAARRSRVRAFRAERSVYCSLHHAALLYPDSAPSAELDALRTDVPGYRDTYDALDSSAGRWERPFLEHMFHGRRNGEDRGISAIPLD